MNLSENYGADYFEDEIDDEVIDSAIDKYLEDYDEEHTDGEKHLDDLYREIARLVRDGNHGGWLETDDEYPGVSWTLRLKGRKSPKEYDYKEIGDSIEDAVLQGVTGTSDIVWNLNFDGDDLEGGNSEDRRPMQKPMSIAEGKNPPYRFKQDELLKIASSIVRRFGRKVYVDGYGKVRGDGVQQRFVTGMEDAVADDISYLNTMISDYKLPGIDDTITEANYTGFNRYPKMKSGDTEYPKYGRFNFEEIVDTYIETLADEYETEYMPSINYDSGSEEEIEAEEAIQDEFRNKIAEAKKAAFNAVRHQVDEYEAELAKEIDAVFARAFDLPTAVNESKLSSITMDVLTSNISEPGPNADKYWDAIEPASEEYIVNVFLKNKEGLEGFISDLKNDVELMSDDPDDELYKKYLIAIKELSSLISPKSTTVSESKLSADEKKKLHPETFGAKYDGEEKYPLNDEEHVRSAISYFHKCPKDKQASLAKKIVKAAKKFGIEISEKSKVMKALNEEVGGSDDDSKTMYYDPQKNYHFSKSRIPSESELIYKNNSLTTPPVIFDKTELIQSLIIEFNNSDSQYFGDLSDNIDEGSVDLAKRLITSNTSSKKFGVDYKNNWINLSLSDKDDFVRISFRAVIYPNSPVISIDIKRIDL